MVLTHADDWDEIPDDVEARINRYGDEDFREEFKETVREFTRGQNLKRLWDEETWQPGSFRKRQAD